MSHQIATKRFYGLWLAVCLSLTCALPRGSASVIVVNTDASVDKYAVAQRAFIEAVAQPTKSYDMKALDLSKPGLAEIVAAEAPMVVYCIGSQAAVAAAAISTDTPIVVSSAMNWQRLPLNDRVVGVANELAAETQLTMFRYLLPELRRIGIIYSPEYNKEWVDRTQREAEMRGIQIVAHAVHKSILVTDLLGQVLPTIEALWLIPDPVIFTSREQVMNIYRISDAARVPVIAHDPVYAHFGAVLVLTADISTMGRQAAGLAKDIIRGRPVESKFQNPVGSEIIVNMRKIKQYGLRLSEKALGSVNKVID